MGLLDKLLRRKPKGVQSEPTAKSGAQVPPTNDGMRLLAGVGEAAPLTAPLDSTIRTYRLMRKQPTIKLARALFTAPVRLAEYGVEADDGVPQARIDYIDSVVGALWWQFTHDILYAFDYGWQAFEKVWAVDGGQYTIGKLKMLLPDHTKVILDKQTGGYRGLTNGGGMGGSKVPLPPEKTLWYTWQREGDNYYGESMMEAAREPFNNWRETMARYNKYSGMVAGPIPMIEYPMGESEDETGKQTEHFLVAQSILNGLSRCKGVVMPNVVAAYARDLAQAGVDPQKLSAWKISFIEASGQHGQEFNEKAHKHEVDMLRAWLVPERAATEGTHGTKAEAEVHGDLVTMSAEAALADIVVAFNKWVVNPLLVVNYGEDTEDTIRVIVEKLDPDKKALQIAIVKSLIGAPNNSDLFLDLVDFEAVFDMVGLPKAQDLAAELKERDEKDKRAAALPPVGQSVVPEDEQDDESADDGAQMSRVTVGEIVQVEGTNKYMRKTADGYEDVLIVPAVEDTHADDQDQ
jgi:hypothetical protein